MEAILSADEFGRIQTQLLELRAVNYQLDDQCKRQEKENSLLRGQIAGLNGELQQANKVLKNRKSLPVGAIARENDSLKCMLMRQDEEFRLQNETLFNELTELMELKKELEKKQEANQKLIEDQGLMLSNLEDNVRHLQAENTVLHKVLSDNKIQFEPFSFLDAGSSFVLDSTDIPETVDLQFKLQTEKEENRILCDQLCAVQEYKRDEIDSLQAEVNRLSEKLRKKQDSFLQFQQEQELLVKELTVKLEQVQTSNAEDIENIRLSYSRALDELTTVQQTSAEREALLKNRCTDLESIVRSLHHQLDQIATKHSAQLADHMTCSQLMIGQAEQRISELMAELDDLRAQLKEYQLAQASEAEQLMSIESKCAAYARALDDSELMAQKYQQEADKYQQESKHFMDKYENQLQENANIRHQLALKTDELKQVETELANCQVDACQLHCVRADFEKQLSDLQDCLQSTRNECSTSVEEQQKRYDELKTQHCCQIEEFQVKCEQLQNEMTEKTEIVNNLEQELRDLKDSRKIHEMKGTAMIKDLKKQVHSERIRADDLQEKLQRFLAESTHGHQALEELFQPVEVVKRHRTGEDGSSSVSSWSLVGGSREGSSISQTPEDDGFTVLKMENDELLRRMTELQQQAWTLEEKVVHLESSNALMADDLLNKTAIIEHYMMDNKSEHVGASSGLEKNTLRRVIGFVSSDDNLRDINRKLQKVLEDTLTKNMHLQKDVEILSEKLSEVAGSEASPSTQKSL